MVEERHTFRTGDSSVIERLRYQLVIERKTQSPTNLDIVALVPFLLYCSLIILNGSRLHYGLAFDLGIEPSSRLRLAASF